MDSIFRLLYFSEQFPKNTAMNYSMLTLCHQLDQVPDMSIEEIAQTCNTNPMMISRIARKIGYKNFQEFRTNAAETVLQSKYSNRNIPMDHIDPQDPAGSYLDYIAQLITTLRAPAIKESLLQICEALHKAKHIHFYGPPHYSMYMLMLLHDLINDGKEIHYYTSEESILLDMETIGKDSLVLLVPSELAIDTSLTYHILETVEHRHGCLVLHVPEGSPLLAFNKGPNLTYPQDHTISSSMAGSFVINMLTMEYRNRYLDKEAQ